MSVINRQDIITDEAFKSLDELAIKLERIVKVGKDAQTTLTGKGINKITKETKDLTAAEVELNKITKQVGTAKAKQNTAYVKQQQELIKTRQKQKELVQETGRELGTIEKLIIRNKKLRDTRKALNLETKKGQSQLRSINKELDKNTKVLKSSNDEYGKQKMNIGNYQSALQGLPGPLGGAARATQGLTSAAWKFIATPIGAIIAALSLAVGTLTSFFTGSEEGQNEWNKITATASVIFGNFKDIVIDLGKSLWKLINFDFDGAAEAFNDAADGVKNFVSESKAEIKIQNELSDLRAKNIVLLRESRLFEARSLTKIAELREKAAKIEETNAAQAAVYMREAIRLNDAIAAKKEEVLTNDLRIAKVEASLSASTTETLNEITDKEVALENARRERATANIRRLKELNTLEKKVATQAKTNVEVTEKALTDIEKLEPDLETKLDAWVPPPAELKARLDRNIAEYKKGQEVIAQLDLEQKEKREELINASIDSSNQIFADFTTLRIQQIGQELSAMEFARDRELEAAGENERKKFAINKRYDNERKRLERAQLNANKQNALFNIAISTAQAIAKASPVIPLMALAAVVGATQAAVVLSQKVPEFDEGAERTPKDYIAGERRPELRKAKGKWSVVDRPTLFKNSPGDKIVSGKETDSILGSIADITGNNMLTDKGRMLSLLNNEYNLERKQKDNSYKLQRSIETLTNVVKNKKEVRVNVNTSRSHVYEKDGNVLVNRVDKYYKR